MISLFLFPIVFISTTKKSCHQSRVYDKKQACFYCTKLYPKLARHLTKVHANEKEVSKALSYKPLTKERQKELTRIRHMGNYNHNVQVLETGVGELILARRPSEGVEACPEDFLPCPCCLGFFKKDELWRHSKTCDFKLEEDKGEDASEEDKKSKKIQEKSKIMLMSQLKPQESQCLKAALAKMKSDEVTIAARNDDLICKYGSIIAERHGQDNLHLVSQGIRQLSRLLIQLRTNNSMGIHLKDFLKPEYFDHIVASVKTLCNFEESSAKSVGIPSLALKLGHAINKCITIQRGKALREKDQVLLQDMDNLEKLMGSEWSDSISYHSLGTLYKRKFNKPDLLPVTEDLEVLRKHLLQKIVTCTATLKAAPTIQNWGELAETTLCRVITFNKRRGGEVSKMLLSSFVERPDWKKTATKGIEDCLEPIEKELCKRYKVHVITHSVISLSIHTQKNCRHLGIHAL